MSKSKMAKRFGPLTASLAAGMALMTWGGAHAQTDTQTPPTPDATASPGTDTAGTSNVMLNDTDKLFLLRAAQSDMAEISTSQMALKKAKDAGVQQTAQTLITAHSQSLSEGAGLALRLGLTPPKDPGVTNMAVAKQLGSAKGKDFDKQYMAAQTEAHENVVALFNMELGQGQNTQVKAFAAKYLPGIEGHTAMIYQVAQSVMAPDSQLRPATPPTVTGVPPSPMDATSSVPGMTGGMGTPTPGGTVTTGQ
jgi:putative membrane protein